MPVTFVFVEALFNRSDSLLGAIEDSSIRALFIACLIFLAVACGFWLVCRFAFARHGEPEAVP